MPPSHVDRTRRRAPPRLVASLEEVVQNISRYQAEVRKEQLLTARMKQVHVWYCDRSSAGDWLFAPSKFVGYADTTGRDYLSRDSGRDGRQTEATLKRWFDVISADSHLRAELEVALRDFLRAHGHSGPRRDVRICVPRRVVADLVAGNREVPDRILVDSSICGGRPHIRGTRVRVTDILELLANGATHSHILADYPYLTEADLRAALAFGAAAAGHRVILTA